MYFKQKKQIDNWYNSAILQFSAIFHIQCFRSSKYLKNHLISIFIWIPKITKKYYILYILSPFVVLSSLVDAIPHPPSSFSTPLLQSWHVAICPSAKNTIRFGPWVFLSFRPNTFLVLFVRRRMGNGLRRQSFVVTDRFSIYIFYTKV